MQDETMKNAEMNTNTRTTVTDSGSTATATFEPAPVGPPTIPEHKTQEVARANASGLQPVVFVHGLWLLPSSWDRWAMVFEEAGYTALTPGWPDDPNNVAE